MQKFKRIAKISFLSMLVLLGNIVAGSWIYHSIAMKKELALTPPPGKMVDVDGHAMHVYSEGDGAQTIVFLSGAGTSAPMLDFKPLWSELSRKYTIAVVEKAGYGWSEVAEVSRDIDVMLEESRTALQLADIGPPYVLTAHSMSGLEAIRWAQKYPEEVEAIIGLDPAIPSVYEVLPIPSPLSMIAATAFARTGLIRLIPPIVNSSAAIESGYLSEEDMVTYRSLFYRRTLTANMREEVKQVQANAKKVDKSKVPVEVPMYFFISDGNGIDIINWREMLAEYVDQLEHGQYVNLDVGHYVHAWKPEFIGKEIDELFMHFLKVEGVGDVN
ncbi:alpha/beta fold hydrolase [Sporosarcina sp. G11-34]|uniref:alpha/beta fold hydrolase n=1 Tax=Sporosarcina sp. G11-34 TaxID=2849605 RepID=UPI0022A91B70|nr:alpha/beta hydrolase [Sporosarcina sp. G11-34]MCZ2259538.1 alpha/beta hydrolase [Sporosarcina sp. G11-34]